MKIGFFDSGLGGLTILRATVKKLPDYNYVYYADTKHLPYGDRSEEEILELTKNALIELFARDCVVVIVACNTASAETLRTLQDSFVRYEYPDRKVLGVIIPTMEALVDCAPRQALLLATRRTVESGKYQRELDKLSSKIELHAVATPKLVPLIEAHDSKKAAEIAISTINDARLGKGDVVVLGCTHYTVLKERLREAYPDLVFLAQDEIIPDKLSEYLQRHPELGSYLTVGNERNIHLSEHKDTYNELAAEFLGGSYVAGDNTE